MNHSGRYCALPSRRGMLAGTALAFGVAAAGVTAGPALAQQKISQANAKYQDHPNGEARCDQCLQFQAPNSCKLVDGEIKPDGWCQLFAPKS
jgi:hypothetical protein